MHLPSVARVDLRDGSNPVGDIKRRFQQELIDGLERTGFVKVVGHGVPLELIEECRALFNAFFAQPDRVKAYCGGISGGQRGYTAQGTEHAKNHPVADLKEFYHVGQEFLPEDAPRKLYPPNVWPEKPARLREKTLLLYRKLEKTAHSLLENIAFGLDLPSHTFSAMIESGNSVLRVAHYPPIEDNVLPGAMRAAPHEDINLITLLCGVDEPGLEILGRDDRWEPVPTLRDEIVVDVGDMLARVTNNTLPATTHRVVAPGEVAHRNRLAMPFFAHPRPDSKLDVLASFVRPERPALYSSISASEYLNERLEQIGLISGSESKPREK